MLKVSQMERLNVFRPKRGAKGDPAKLGARELTTVGKVHLTVFDPDGRKVVGFLVKRPDVASMIKVSDVFLALDSYAVCDLGLVATKGDDSFDDKARERLGIDWDSCIIWRGMDARTTDGKDLGWVSDVEFSPKSGKVSLFFVGDGSVSTALVGNIEIPADLLRGYRDGYMLVDPKAAGLALDGGAAAKAGEAYAKAKYEGGKAAKKLVSSAGSAVEKGAFGLGKMIGDTKRAFEDSSTSTRPAPQEVESLSEPIRAEGALPGEVGEPREFVPVGEAEDSTATSADPVQKTSVPHESTPQKKTTSKKPSSKKKSQPKKRQAAGDDAARAIGRQLGKTKGMFSGFLSEYKKASK